MPTDSCGPRNASTAAFCAIDVGFEVLWLCSLLIAAITAAGPSPKPMRHPVIEYVFESDPATSTVSFAPLQRGNRVRLAVIEETAVALVRHQPDAAARGRVRRSAQTPSRSSTPPLGFDGELMMTIRVLSVMYGSIIDAVRVKPFGFVGLDEHAFAAGVVDDVLIRDPVRDRDDDFVARIEQHLHQVEDDVLAAHGDDAFVGRVVGAVIARDGDRRSPASVPACRPRECTW